MSKKAIYYVCEWDGIDHNFKTVHLTVDGVRYPNTQICKKCGSVFNFGGINVQGAQLAGIDLSQYKLKEATETNQAVLHATAMAKSSNPTGKRKAEDDALFRELLDTLLTEEEETKAIPPRSIWRMDSK